jgi:putative hydrolase of the HAD superfamily
VVIYGAHEVLAEPQRGMSGNPETAVAEPCPVSLGVLDGNCVLPELGHDASMPTRWRMGVSATSLHWCRAQAGRSRGFGDAVSRRSMDEVRDAYLAGGFQAERVSYKGLILDFGGVVTTDFYGALDAFSVRAGLDDGAFLRAIRENPEGRKALAAAERGQIPQREFEVTMGRLLGLDDNGLFANALADLRPRPEITGLTARARAKGVRVAALSNSWGAGDYDPYAGWDLDQMFDAVVISDQVGMRKPKPEISELTAARLGLKPSESLFVDDTEHNLPAARHLGMGTLLFTGADGEVAEIERLLGIG